MPMKRAKIFQNGQSQAVRLPREFRLEGNEVFVKHFGNAVVLIPVQNSWDSLIGSLELFSSDFMQDRNQPNEEQLRETLRP